MLGAAGASSLTLAAYTGCAALDCSVRSDPVGCVCCCVVRRPEAVGDLLQLALPVLMAGLQDRDDSVQAAAAEALVPLAPMLLQMQVQEVRCGCDQKPA